MIVLIDCGGNLNISEVLEPLPDSQVFVLDSHIPYDLDNVYDGDTVKIVIPGTFELEVSIPIRADYLIQVTYLGGLFSIYTI